MVSVTVDVDMDAFELDDLLDGIDDKLKRIKKDDREKLLEFCRDTIEFLEGSIEMPELKSLDDKNRMEYLSKVFGKYSTSQIEAALPV